VPSGYYPNLRSGEPSQGADGPDDQFVQALRDAACRLDQTAAELEERRAFDLADQMRGQAHALRQTARERDLHRFKQQR